MSDLGLMASKETILKDISEENDIGLQILFQWFSGECLNQPVELLIVNHNQYEELGHQKIFELQQFMVNHGAVEYIRIVGDHNSPYGQVFTSAIGE